MARRDNSRYETDEQHSLVDSLKDVSAAKFYTGYRAGLTTVITILAATAIGFSPPDTKNSSSLKKGVSKSHERNKDLTDKEAERKESKAYRSWLGHQRADEFKDYRIRQGITAKVRFEEQETQSPLSTRVRISYDDNINKRSLKAPSVKERCSWRRYEDESIQVGCRDKIIIMLTKPGEGYDGFMTRVFNGLSDIYGDPLNTAKNIAAEITGKQLPPSLVMKYMEKFAKNNVIGDHNFINSEIRVKKKEYIETLGTALHEIGHSIYMGQELSDQTPAKDDFEEAAAYCFMVAGLTEFARLNPEQTLEVELALMTQNSRMTNYRNGSTEEHDIGWAIARTIAKHFNGDYAEAFNFLLGKYKWKDLGKPALAQLKKERQKQNRTLIAQRTVYETLRDRGNDYTKKDQQRNTPKKRKQHQYRKH